MIDIYILDPKTIDHPPFLKDHEFDLTWESEFWIESQFKQMGINVIRADLDTIKTLDCPWFYIQNFFPWAINDFFKVYNGFFDYFDPELRECFERNGYIIFENIGEGETVEFFEKFYNYARSSWIDTSRVIYDVSSLNAKSCHTAFCDKHFLPDNMTIIQSYFWEHIGHYYQMETIEEKISFSPRDFKNRPKVFLNFNRRLRGHRPAFVSLLAHHGLLDQGHVSLFSHDIERTPTIYRTSVLYQDDDLKKRIDNGYKLIKDKMPLIVDYTDSSVNYAEDPQSIRFHQSSYFSLVSCTYFESRHETIQMNEKIFKPIAYKQPFILTGLSGTLSHLHEYGFKTFHPHIDETYDTIECDIERANAILKEVTRLCNLTKHEWDKLIHDLTPVLIYNLARLRNEGQSIAKSNILSVVRIATDEH